MTGTILLVEDNPYSVKLVLTVLEKGGYLVRVAEDGESALTHIRDDPPELVLLDIHMPGIDGYQVCAELKSDSRLADIPVIFLSGLEETHDKVKGFSAGGADYVVKPFQPEELLARVAVHLELFRSRRRIRKDAETLRRNLEELAETSRRLTETEKSLALATLTAGLAHELNNPVNYLMVGAEALDRDVEELLALSRPPEDSEGSSGSDKRRRWEELVHEIPELLGGIRLGAERSARVIKRLKLLQQGIPTEQREVKLNEVIEQALALAIEHAGTPNHLEQEITADETVLGDRDQLVQMLMHVVVNAIEAARFSTGSEVRVTTVRWEESSPDSDYHGPGVCISVHDSGPGITPELRRRLFDPFVTTKSVGEGAGLGLPLALRIAREHQGTIEVSESPLGGTLVQIVLPCTCSSDG